MRGDTLHTVPEAAAILACSKTTIYGLIQRGELRTIKLGRSRRVPGSAIDALIAEKLDQAETGWPVS